MQKKLKIYSDYPPAACEVSMSGSHSLISCCYGPKARLGSRASFYLSEKVPPRMCFDDRKDLQMILLQLKKMKG